MTLVQGELKLVTDAPDEVSQVWIQAPKERLHGTGMITDGRASEQVKNGVVSFNALPGAAVMVLLVNGIPSLTVKILIPDKANATLRECIEAVGLADDGTLDALEELSLEVARIAAQIASADRLETWASETASAAAQAQTSKDEANDAANRAGVHESNARQAEAGAEQSEINAKQSETNSKQSELNADAAAGRASLEADNVRGELQSLADDASDSADSAADSAAEAKIAETNAKAHETSSLSAAERAEFAAEETIQQVEGDFATRNYVDSSIWLQPHVPAGTDLNTLTTPCVRILLNGAQPNKPFNSHGFIEVLPIVNDGTLQRATDHLTLKVWKRKTEGGVFQPWEMELSKADLDTKTDKSYVDSVKWLQPQVPVGTDLDTLTTPCVRILPNGEQPNKPFPGTGVIEVLPIIGGGTMQRATNFLTLEVWKRRTVNGVFASWSVEPTKAVVDSKADKSYADTKADKSYVDSVKWLQPQVPATADLDTYTTPCVRLLLFGTQPNKPFDGAGVLEVLPIVSGGTIQRATDYRTLEVWKRKTQGGIFQEWEKEPTNETVSQTVNGILDNSPVFTQEWTRKYPLMVTTGAAASNYSPGGDYRVRIQFTAPILRWRVHISTAHPYSTAYRSAADISGVSVGANLDNGEMETSEVLLGTNTTIEEGGEWVSDWTRYDLRQDSVLALTVNRHGDHSDFLLAGWLNQNGTWVRKGHIPIWIWIEAETYAATPSVVLIGDSTGAGQGSIEPVWDSAVAIAGRKQEFLPVLYASSGDNLVNYTNTNRYLLNLWEHFARADSTVIQAGSNDIHGGSSLTQMKTTFERVLPIAKKLGVKIYAATIKPRYPVGNMEDVRLAYNAWLKTLPFGIDGVIDYDGAVAPDGVILPEDNADGAHLTKSGQMKLASAYSYPIARPRVTETWKP